MNEPDKEVLSVHNPVSDLPSPNFNNSNGVEGTRVHQHVYPSDAYLRCSELNRSL